MKLRILISAVLVTALALPVIATTRFDVLTRFPDVPDDHQYVYAIRWASDASDPKFNGNPIFEGFPDGNFGPDRELTEAQFVKVVDRFFDSADSWTRAQTAALLYYGVQGLISNPITTTTTTTTSTVTASVATSPAADTFSVEGYKFSHTGPYGVPDDYEIPRVFPSYPDCFETRDGQRGSWRDGPCLENPAKSSYWWHWTFVPQPRECRSEWPLGRPMVVGHKWLGEDRVRIFKIPVDVSKTRGKSFRIDYLVADTENRGDAWVAGGATITPAFFELPSGSPRRTLIVYYDDGCWGGELRHLQYPHIWLDTCVYVFPAGNRTADMNDHTCDT